MPSAVRTIVRLLLVLGCFMVCPLVAAEDVTFRELLPDPEMSIAAGSAGALVKSLYE
jgi:hypothetical protein